MKVGIIYKATGPTGKIYIGKTVQTLHRRRICHNSNAFNKNVEHYNCHFYKAIRKYGTTAFKWDIVYKDISEEQLPELEQEVIKQYNSLVIGYNSTSGGEGSSGFRHTEESKIKMSISSKGQIVSDETRKKLSQMRKGKKKSKEHIEKIKVSNRETRYKKFEHLYKDFLMINKDNSIVGKYYYPSECARNFGLQTSLIWKCLRKERPQHKGFKFIFVEEYGK